eukprot:6196081-Pleurochrysis_carterae.AAC.1
MRPQHAYARAPRRRTRHACAPVIFRPPASCMLTRRACASALCVHAQHVRARDPPRCPDVLRMRMQRACERAQRRRARHACAPVDPPPSSR